MKLKLRVLDPKTKKLPTIENDGRWNCEKEFEIPERFILKLAEEIADQMVDEQYYSLDRAKRLRREKIMYMEVERIIKSTRTWKKIHTMISDLGFETSRFTRISLFEELINTKRMKELVREKVMELEQGLAGTKIPEEKPKPQIAPPTQSPKISKSILDEFLSKID